MNRLYVGDLFTSLETFPAWTPAAWSSDGPRDIWLARSGLILVLEQDRSVRVGFDTALRCVHLASGRVFVIPACDLVDRAAYHVGCW